MDKEINDLEVKRLELIASMEKTLANTELSEEEATASFDADMAAVKSLEAKKARLETVKAMKAIKAVKEAEEEDSDKEEEKECASDEMEKDDEDKEKTMNSFYINKGVAPAGAEKGLYVQKFIARDIVKMHGETEARNILAASTSKNYASGLLKSALTTAQPVVGPDVREFIDLLTADCVVRKYAKIVSMPNNNLTYPRQRLGSSASWVGEGATYVPSAADFDTINFVGKKLTGFTYTTLEFNNFSLPGAVDHITSDLANQVALAEDRTFIMGTTAGALAPSYSLVGSAGTKITSSGTDSVSVAADLAKVKSSLQTKFVNIARGVVFGSPAVFNSLENLQTSFGVYPFRDEIRSGKLNGFTIAETAQIPSDVDTSAAQDGSAKNGSPLVFVAPQHLIIADAGRYQLRSTDQGSFEDAGTTINAFSQDMIAYKLANWVDFGVEHEAAVVVLNTVGWTNFNVDGAWQLVEDANSSTSGASVVKGKKSN
ncbi:phage major capsid protein [Gluconobacter sp. LMG 1744]|uniref:phage major capsid protein n=1 Tax=Gluconobacter cadivus TaxID=2728101 RepID=UPI001884D5EA|nr:phage major capsid protein [Gluconobacter cadivus]MBF0892759.1 phage major capsid protein [Gluconobacter cadivus]